MTHSSKQATVLCLVLAAGNSSRFGDADKRLAKLKNGKGVLEQTLANIQAAGLPYKCVIRHDELDLPEYQSFRQNCLGVHNAELGMGHTLSSALKQLRSQHQAFIICLGDMPFIQPSSYQTMASALTQTSTPTSASAVIPYLAGHKSGFETAGHPIGIKDHFIDLFIELSGDKGGKVVLKTYPELITFIALKDKGIYRDIDTAEALIESKEYTL